MDTCETPARRLLSRPTREPATVRRFPPVDQAWRDAPELSTRQAALTRTQRYLGLSLTPEARYTRLLVLLFEAADAEQCGRPRRAGFFWREFHRRLRADWDNQSMWRAAAVQAPWTAGAADPGLALRDCVAEEIVIDLHLAFYNGHALSPTMDGASPAFMHARMAAAVAALAGYDDAQQAAIIAPATLREIDALLESNDLDRAIASARTLAQRFPDAAHQVRLARLHHECAMRRMKEADDSNGHARNARQLEAALRQLESDRQRWPAQQEFYAVGTQLAHAHAVQLANAGELAEALAAVCRAEAYWPRRKHNAGLHTQLEHMMQTVRQGADSLQAQLRAAGNAQLTAEGKRIVRQGQLGFSLAEQAESDPLTAEIRTHGKAARELGGGVQAPAPAYAETGEATVVPQSATARHDTEPPLWWLFSRQDGGAKAVAAAACALLAFAAYTSVDQQRLHALHSAAYAELLASAAAANDESALRAAETFLEQPTLAHDARAQRVRQLYEQAFTRWFVARGQDLDAPARDRIARFRQLNAKAPDRQGGVQ